jgi:phage terminase large subunit
VDEMPQWVQKRGVGMDFGFTNDPTAIVECGMYNNDLYINELCYKTHMTSGDIIREMRQHGSLKVIADSADPRLIKKIRMGGINIYAVEKAAGSILAGLDKMQEMNLKVTRQSVNVLEELRNYTCDKDNYGNFIIHPIDFCNHAVDAVRYEVFIFHHKVVQSFLFIKKFDNQIHIAHYLPAVLHYGWLNPAIHAVLVNSSR